MDERDELDWMRIQDISARLAECAFAESESDHDQSAAAADVQSSEPWEPHRVLRDQLVRLGLPPENAERIVRESLEPEDVYRRRPLVIRQFKQWSEAWGKLWYAALSATDAHS